LNLTEIPTLSIIDTIERAREEAPEPPPTVAELQANLLERVEIALSDFELPAPARLLKKQIITGTTNPLEIKIVYLGDERIAPEAETAMLEKARRSLNYEVATISLERVPAQIGEVEFDRSQFRLTASGMIQLDFAGRILRENPQLSLAVASPPRKKNNSETENNSETVDERFQAIAEYLETRWQIAPDRIKQSVEPETENKTLIKFE
jgi:hypothetical protein